MTALPYEEADNLNILMFNSSVSNLRNGMGGLGHSLKCYENKKWDFGWLAERYEKDHISVAFKQNTLIGRQLGSKSICHGPRSWIKLYFEIDTRTGILIKLTSVCLLTEQMSLVLISQNRKLQIYFANNYDPSKINFPLMQHYLTYYCSKQTSVIL